MAIPSGGGSEVLSRGTIDYDASTAWHYLGGEGFSGASGTTLRTVDANKIITILNFNVTERVNASGKAISVDVRHEAASLTPRILQLQSIPAEGTFIYNDKLVLLPTDYWRIATNATATLDISFVYIIQDWN